MNHNLWIWTLSVICRHRWQRSKNWNLLDSLDIVNKTSFSDSNNSLQNEKKMSSKQVEWNRRENHQTPNNKLIIHPIHTWVKKFVRLIMVWYIQVALRLGEVETLDWIERANDARNIVVEIKLTCADRKDGRRKSIRFFVC